MSLLFIQVVNIVFLLLNVFLSVTGMDFHDEKSSVMIEKVTDLLKYKDKIIDVTKKFNN